MTHGKQSLMARAMACNLNLHQDMHENNYQASGQSDAACAISRHAPGASCVPSLIYPMLKL